MPLEKGGRADKMGNRYEIRCIIYEMLKVLREVNYSIVIEALGMMRLERIFWLRILREEKNINNVKFEMQARNIGRLLT